MNPLIFTLSGCAAIGFLILVWLYTPSGKRWLENL